MIHDKLQKRLETLIVNLFSKQEYSGAHQKSRQVKEKTNPINNHSQDFPLVVDLV